MGAGEKESPGGDTTTEHRRRGTVRAVAVTALLVLMYVVVIVIYASGDDTSALDTREPADASALVYLDVVKVDGENFSMDARVSVYPGAALLDENGYLQSDLVVEVSPLAAGGRLTFAAGTSAGALPVTLYADGDITRWPFDVHDASDVVVRVFSETSSGPSPVQATVAVTDSLTGWTVGTDGTDPAGGQSFEITAQRTGGSLIFALALCVVLLILPACALFVTVQTIRNRRKFQPPMVTWFAVMLFAVLPIRNLFPGSPPIGSWVDYTLVLWVVAGLATSMALYVLAWWRGAP